MQYCHGRGDVEHVLLASGDAVGGGDDVTRKGLPRKTALFSSFYSAV